MSNAEKPKGELQLIKFGDKVLSVYRRCSCGGDVIIHVDSKTEKSTATCKNCGATTSWGGKE